jgi:hypothetical protein
VLAPPASATRLAMLCAAAFNSSLGAALVLAAPAASMRDAVLCAS